MATACLTQNGNSTGPSQYNQFYAVAQLGYGNRYNFGYQMYRRYYFYISKRASTFSTTLRPSWNSSSYSATSTGTFADTGWVSLGNQTCGTTVSLPSVSVQYTGGSGKVYKSTTSAGSYTVPRAQHTITFNANGGSGAPGNQTKTYGVALTLSSTKPTRAGYTFLGWSTSSTATSATYSAGGNYTPDQWGGTVTLYAVWSANSYTLYVYPNGGTWNNSTETQSFTLNYNATKTMPIPTKTGYTFGGWAWSSYGTMSNSYFPCSVLSSSSNGISVYNNQNNGSVTHTYVQGSSDKPAYDNCHITITKSADVASPGLGGFYRTVVSEYNTTYYHTFYAKLPVGYYFGHYSNAMPDGTSFTWLSDNTGTGSWKMYAYKVVTGSSGSTRDFGYIAANANSGSSTETVTWYLGANQITKSPTTAQTFTMAEGNTWMWPMWIQNRYTVVYKANEGTGSMSNSIHTYDETKALISNTFTRTGYHFNKWNTKEDGSGTSYSNGISVTNLTSVPDGTVTLYAQWTPWTHTITYNGNASGVTNLPSDQTKEYGVNISISSTIPKRPGYRFCGWATTATGEVAYDPSQVYFRDQDGGTVTLYAVWQVSTLIGMEFTAIPSGYTISNNPSGEAVMPSLTIPFTLSTITENKDLSFYYHIYYYDSNKNKKYLTETPRGGYTPSSVNNSSSFILSGDEIKQYILDTGNYQNIILNADAYTAEVSADTRENATPSNFTIKINNYTKPNVDIITAYRTSSGSVKLKVRIDFPNSYNITPSSCAPTLTFGSTTLSETYNSVTQLGNRVIYTYNLTQSVGGDNILIASYTDGLFSSMSRRRIAATTSQQSFEVEETTTYSFEFIEN